MAVSPTRARNLLRTYGITAHQWLDLIRPGKCPLCEKKYSPTRAAVVEHNHITGLVRGATCAPCNYRLGLLHDDDGWLRRAMEYLQNPPAIDIIGECYVPGSPPTLR